MSEDYEPVKEAPNYHWHATPRCHPRRVILKQNWRRFRAPSMREDSGLYEYATDVELAHWGLRRAAGLPDATEHDAYHE